MGSADRFSADDPHSQPAVAGFEAQNINEHLCLAAARALGLPAANSRLETFEDEIAIVVERFDRTTETEH
ncbi:MAG: HipA domain-containing protein [Rhodococcus sp. (in: high G+C Gram-positive bacteria)]